MAALDQTAALLTPVVVFQYEGTPMLGMIVLGIAVAAAGPEVPAAPPAVEKPAKPIIVEGNRRVCHEITATGSILPKRICKTVNEWKQEVAASQEFAAQRGREQTIYQHLQFMRKQRVNNP